MKNQIRRLGVGIVSVVLACMTAQGAVYINGEISFVGGATLNGGLDTATEFTSFFGPMGPGTDPAVAFGATGTYASVPIGTPAGFSTFAFDPAPVGATPLWSFTVGGTTYSFEITSLVVSFQNSRFLNIEGAGVGYATGYDPTPGSWSIVDTGFPGSPVFTFGAATTVVPEPSTAALILGGSILFLGLRRVTRRSSV